MAERFCYDVLKVIVAQTCQNIGWHAVQSTPLEVLTDILHRYLLELPRTTHGYCEQFGRTDPNLDDLGLAFHDLDISVAELQEYIHNVDVVHAPFEVPKFPILRPSQLNFQPDEENTKVIKDDDIEQVSKATILPEDHLETEAIDGEVQERGENAEESSTLHSLLTASSDQEDSENPLKRSLETNSVLPPSKRARLMKEEELSSMNVTRDLTSVFMSSGGVISHAREGKLPDAKAPQYALPVAPQNSVPNSNDQTVCDTQNGELPHHNPSDVHSNDEGGESTLNQKASIKMTQNAKKTTNRPKKSTSSTNKSSNDSKSVAAKKVQDGNASIVGDRNQDKEPTSDKAKKSSSKSPRPSKRATNKKATPKLSVLGIAPLKGSGENSEMKLELNKRDSDNSAQIDDTIESVIQQSCDVINRKKPIASEEESDQNTSLDDTIEDVIQKAMMGTRILSTITAARVSKPKDIYDFSDSVGEGLEIIKKSKANTSNTVPPVPPLFSSPSPLTTCLAFQIKKEKHSVEIPAIPETPDQPVIVIENLNKSSKKRAKPRLTKAAKKELPPLPSHFDMHKFDTERDEDYLKMGGLGMQMEANKEPAMMKSPFHNPPGFPCRPPLPPVFGSFHSNLRPSFSSNLGPPPPAHQGSSTSKSLSSSMLASPQLYPSFPRMPTFPQFGDIPFSRPPSFTSGLSSSSFSGMTPTPAHTPQPKFYSSSSNNNVTSYNVSSSAVSTSTKSSANPVISTPSSDPNSKLSLDVQVTSSSFPKSQSQASPTLVVSVKSEPLPHDSISPKMEITSIFGSSKEDDVTEKSTDVTIVPVKIKTEPKEKSKESKKDKKGKAAKKDKGKREKKNKSKETKVEPLIIHEVISNSKAAAAVIEPVVEQPPVVLATPKKEKNKGKDKRKNKSKDIEIKHVAPVKEEPVQKIKLKIGLGGAGGSSKCYIQPSSPPPPPVEEKPRTPTPPPAPKPAVVKTSPETKQVSTPVTRGRKKSSKFTPNKTTPPKKSVGNTSAITPPVEKTTRSSASRGVITETVGTTVDEDGNKIWICPTCGCPDDGSAMIGCDSCDDWHHWICVKIVVPPKEEDSWFCARCISKQQEQLTARTRKKKKHKHGRQVLKKTP